jgi:CRP-like cAMP-binding protein
MGYLTDTATGCAFVEHVVAARNPLPLRWYADFDFGLVRHGIVIRERIDDQGRSAAVDLVGPSGLVPLGPDRGFSNGVSAYAATDVSICLLTRRQVLAHGDEGAYRDLCALESQVISRMERLIEARSRPTVIERVAALFCTLADSLHPGRRLNVLPPDLQRTDMAAILGVRRETLSRALGELVMKGLVRRDVEGIRILDRSGLEAVGSHVKRTSVSGVRRRAVLEEDEGAARGGSSA